MAFSITGTPAFVEDEDPYIIDAGSPPAGALILLPLDAVGDIAGALNPASITGVCDTWNFEGEVEVDPGNGRFIFLYSGIATGTGNITVLWNEEMFGLGHLVVAVTGATGVVQTVGANGTGTAMAVNLAAFSGPNWTFAFGVGDASAAAGLAFSPGADFTELADSDTVSPFGFHKAAEWQEASDTSVTMTMANSGPWGIIGAEIQVAAAGRFFLLVHP